MGIGAKVSSVCISEGSVPKKINKKKQQNFDVGGIFWNPLFQLVLSARPRQSSSKNSLLG